MMLRELLSTPSVLLGLVTFIGLCLQKKSVDYIIKGTITTVIGYTLLSVGSNVLQTQALNDFATLISFDFHVQGVVPNMEAVASLGIAQYGTLITQTMLVGMMANLYIARNTKFHYIFLTGHHTLYMACLLVVVLKQSHMASWQIVIAAGLVLGLLMSIMPGVMQKDMVQVVKNDKIAYGHFSVFGCFVASKVASLVKDKKKEINKDIQIHPRIGFMKDSTVCIFIVMSIVFLLVTGIAAAQVDLIELNILYDETMYANWIIYALSKSAIFAASIYVILAGVRMMVAEMVPAFKGIAKKVVPNGKPAVDCPIVFPYAPNSMMVGFLMSFIGGIITMFILLGLNYKIGYALFPIIVPGVVCHFFCGGAAGVFSNAKGGTRGCIIGSLVHGIFITILSILIMPMLGMINLSGTTFSDSDYCVIGMLLGKMSSIVSGNLLFIICIILFIIPVIFHRLSKKGVE